MRAVRPLFLLLLTVLFAFCVSAPVHSQTIPPAEPGAGVKPPAAVDAIGDPLPAHALTRLGTVRFRISDFLRAAALSADGKLLVLANSRGVVLMDAVTGKEIRPLSQNLFSLQGLAITPDGKWVATTGFNNVIQLWNATNGQLARQFTAQDVQQRFVSVAFSGNGKVVVGGVENFGRPNKLEVYAWETDTGKRFGPYAAIQNFRVQAVLSHDGKLIATFGNQFFGGGPAMDPTARQTIQLWDVATGKEVKRFKTDRNVITAAAIAPDGKTVAATTGQSTVHIWEVNTGKELRRIAGRRGLGKLLEFSPDGRYLVAGSNTGSVQLWETKSWRRIDNIAPNFQLHGVVFPGPGQVLAFGLEGQTVCLWDAVKGTRRGASDGHEHAIKALSFTGDEKQIVSVDAGGKFVVWDLAAGKALRNFILQAKDENRFPGSYRQTMVALSPGGKYVAVQDTISSGTVRLWNMETHEVVCDLEGPSGFYQTNLVFSPDGNYLAALGGDASVYVWDVATGEERHKLSMHKGGGRPNVNNGGRLAFSPHGKKVAASCQYFDPNVGRSIMQACLWDMESGKEIIRLEQPFGALQVLAFSPDDKLLALSGNNPPGVTLYDAVTGKEKKLIAGIPGGLSCLAFAPDGRTLAAASFAAGGSGMPVPAGLGPVGPAGTGPTPTIYLVELASGQVRSQLTGHQGSIQELVFTRDGRKLASAGADTTILLWDLIGNREGKAAGAPTPQQLTTLWMDLSGVNGPQAQQAIGRLTAFPDLALELFKKELRPAKSLALDQKGILKLIGDLDHPRFKLREQASMALEKLGRGVLPELQKALQNNPSLEAQQRMEKIVAHLDQETASPKELQQARAVEVLERIGTPPAQELLAVLAGGVPGEILTEQAGAALARMKGGT